MLDQVDDFLQALMSYDKEHIHDSSLNVVKQCYLKKPDFHPDQVRTKSTAAAGLCAWTINIVRYYEVGYTLYVLYIICFCCEAFHDSVYLLWFQIYCEVIPKRLALAQANTELENATTKLLAVQKKLLVSKNMFL